MRKWRVAFLIVGVLFLVGIVAAEEPTYIDFIHYENGTQVAVTPDGFINLEAGYNLLPYKWKAFPVTYYVNPANADGMARADVVTAVKRSFQTWDAATGKQLFRFGGTTTDNQFTNTPNHRNTIMFGYGLPTNVIGLTRVFYIPSQHKIVETDMKLNDYFPWSVSYNSRRMIVRNIATHEAGHVCGLGDLYEPRWSDLTMYGYSSKGETKKQSLTTQDILGLRAKYGA